MLISMAYAQEAAAVVDGAVLTSADGDTAVVVGEAPSMASALFSNVGLILVMVILFYVLLIRPQQKRFAAHTQMLDGLKKGDKIVTAGGLVGTIEKIKDGDDEVVVNLGDSKVTAMRSTIQSKAEKPEAKTPAKKDDKKADKK